MTLKALGLTALSAALAFGLAGSANAASSKKNQASMHGKSHVTSVNKNRLMSSYFPRPRTFSQNGIGHYVVAPGDSAARINRSYPVDANPPSLAQTYNLRGLKMNEMRN